MFTLGDQLSPRGLGDVFQLISMYLSIPDIGNSSLVSKQFRTLLDNEQNWRIRCQTLLGTYDMQLELPPQYETWKEFAEKGVVLSFDDDVGGNVGLNKLRTEADHHSSYGTSRTAQSFRDNIHYIEVQMCFKTSYAGFGFIEVTKELPGPGRGAWLGPAGAHMWVSGSGLWRDESHAGSAASNFEDGDTVGCLLDLRRGHRCAYFFKDGVYSGNKLPVVGDQQTHFCFCFCIGDGRVLIKKRFMPSKAELEKLAF